MGRCCGPGDFDDVFSDARAREDAKRYRRKGLDGTARRLVAALRARGIGGWSVLEVGGGIGAIQIELLRAGAVRATNVELAKTYEGAASELLVDAALADRVERRIGDFVTQAASAPDADAVVLHRVVCCYPDVDALVGTAAGKAQRMLLLTMPVERWWMRAGAVVLNATMAVRRSHFRFFVHPYAAVRAAAERQGLRSLARENGVLWQLVTFDRP